MTNFKHTPGPWKLVETKFKNIISSWNIHVGEYAINVFPFKRAYSEDRTQSGLITDHQKMADAQLITTSPDLLDALQDLYGQVLQAKEGFGIYASSPSMDESIRNAEIAIAKATHS
jgi:hypothetical protein